MANFPISINNDLFVQQGNSGMLLNGEDYYCCEEVDDADTRQLAQLIELQQDSCRMSIDTDMAPVVDTSLYLAVGSEGQQSKRGHIS